MNYGYIYKFTIIPTGEFYVGLHKYKNQTTLDKLYWGSGSKWKQLLKQYGKENVKREILEWCKSELELEKAEEYWVEKLNARQEGLNIAPGGGKRPVLFGEDNGMYGKQHTQYTKTLISKKSSNWQKENKGVSYSKLLKWRLEHPDEYSKAQSKAAKHNKGKKFTDERKENIRKSSHKKSVICIETNMIYESTKAAERATGIRHDCISSNCRGLSAYTKSKNSNELFHWRFI